MEKYDHTKIERKWREVWRKENIYKTEEVEGREKFYILDMFPYPSGVGLHVGHPKGYIATDIISRYKRMKGFNVLHPMGWDAFGLPAEQYALKNKVHPAVATAQNIATFKQQLEQISLNYDWEREIATTDPEFYKWTQWAFIQMFKKGLVYESNEPINWCPSCKTGLANEDLENGLCERCGSVVEKKPIRQWVIAITKYADRLLEDLDALDWKENIKELQRNWIGRSEGSEISFKLTANGVALDKTVEVFTTRADTLFGATYMVLSPEHDLVHALEDSIENIEDVYTYVNTSAKKTEMDRLDMTKEKTGVELKGIHAINPVNGEGIPIFLADYVLAHYGTGAIMAVPAHDERDYEFAKKFNVPVRTVIANETGTPRENEEFRNGGAAVIFDPHTQKYAVPQWRDDGRIGLYAGGVDDGETVHNGILREVQEESGLTDYAHIEWLDVAYAHYFNRAKKVNRMARAEGLLIVLKNNQPKEVTLEEHENFELVWKSAQEIQEYWEAHNTDGTYSHYIEFLTRGVVKAIELGFDTTSDPNTFVFTPRTQLGIVENSGKFSGLSSEDAKQKITEKVGGKMKTTYKLRDWVFARQRYWGEPIPLIHCEACGVVPVPENELPLLLPEVESYEPTGTGESPLANIEDWVRTTCPSCSGEARRETNTMPQWAGSSWYYLRYIDPKNTTALIDKDKEKYWSPVDFYVGGAEHATRHLIYARFWHKFLFDIGVVAYEEPFSKLQTVGLIHAEDGRKMSKRWGNVINPDEIIKTFGADTLRVYEMFMGPFDQAVNWSSDGLLGPRRFLERVWKLQSYITDETPEHITVELHKTIKKVSFDIEEMKYNTAISQMMIFTNAVEKVKKISMQDFHTFLKLLSPFAPHITQELWENTGGTGFILSTSWPTYEEQRLTNEHMSIAVQINGKVRGSVTVAYNASQDEVLGAVTADEKLGARITKEPVRVVYVANKLINIVVDAN